MEELYNTGINVRVPRVLLLLHICEILASRFSNDNSYSVFFSVPSGRYSENTWNCVTTSSFHSISN